jgi:hypothetical protein
MFPGVPSLCSTLFPLSWCWIQWILHRNANHYMVFLLLRFLEYCKIPQLLPVTIACHNKDRCWSASRESRSASPFENYPNLLLV